MNEEIELYDEVCVSNASLKTHGQYGKVTRIIPMTGGMVAVKLYSDKTISIHPRNLNKINTVMSTASTKTQNHKPKYLAFVYFHSDPENPTTISEACDSFNENKLGDPELTIYGTKEEILDKIVSDKRHLTFNNTFIILASDVCPVQRKITSYMDWND